MASCQVNGSSVYFNFINDTSHRVYSETALNNTMFDVDRNLPVLLLQVLYLHDYPAIAEYLAHVVERMNNGVEDGMVLFAAIFYIIIPAMTSKNRYANWISSVPSFFYGLNSLAMLIDSKKTKDENGEEIDIKVYVWNPTDDIFIFGYYMSVMLFICIVFNVTFDRTAGIEVLILGLFMLLGQVVEMTFILFQTKYALQCVVMLYEGIHMLFLPMAVVYFMTYAMCLVMNFGKRNFDKTGLALLYVFLLFCTLRFIKYQRCSEQFAYVFFIATMYTMYNSEAIHKDLRDFIFR